MVDKLGERMKRYEAVSDARLINLMPVIIRVDGNAFHTKTKGIEKPFDPYFMEAMDQTLLHLCNAVQNCRFGFVESDEISLVLFEPSYLAESYFDNRVNKLVSITAAEASCAFRKALNEILEANHIDKSKYKKLLNEAVFDSRAYNMPLDDVENYFIWRQKDATRNCILSLGQYYFSQKQLNGLKQGQVVEKLREEAGYDVSAHFKELAFNGRACYKVDLTGTVRPGEIEGYPDKKTFIIDREVPPFVDAWSGRPYINKHLTTEAI